MNNPLTTIKDKFIEICSQMDFTDIYKNCNTHEIFIKRVFNCIIEHEVNFYATDVLKSATESEKLRAQGNELYVKKDSNNISCFDALKLYAKAIAFAPHPSKQLALAYANRSLILFKFGLHTECIQDIERALALNFPDNLKAKLYIRKTECLVNLKNYSVENMIEESQHWLDKMSPNDSSKQTLQKKIQVLECKTLQTKSSAQDTRIQLKIEKSKNKTPFPTIVSYNNEVPCASDAVAIKYNKRYGRHTIATRNIRPGEVIAVEKSYSFLLDTDNMQTHCSNCLRVSWANIPCKYCTYAMYCSEECMNNEWKKCHDVECAIFPSLIQSGFSDGLLFGMRLAVLALREAGDIPKLKAMLKEVDEYDDLRTKGFSRDGKLYSDRYSGVYSLVTNIEKIAVRKVIKKSLITCQILYLLATRTAIFGAKIPGDPIALAKNDDVTFFGGFILRNMNIIACNSHGFYKGQGLGFVECGTAVMPFCSLINHSCDPNVSRQSRSEHLVLRAKYPIRKGEQILDNYGYYYGTLGKEKRHKELLERYYFSCDCVSCQEDWPVLEKLQSSETLAKKPEDNAMVKNMIWKFNQKMNEEKKSVTFKDMLNQIHMLHHYVQMPCEEMCLMIINLEKMNYLDGDRFDIPEICTCEE